MQAFLDKSQHSVGFDASTKHDSTAIVAVTPQGQKLRLVFHRIFQPHPHDPLDFEGTIEATLHELKHRFRLVKVLFDPMQMVSTATSPPARPQTHQPNRRLSCRHASNVAERGQIRSWCCIGGKRQNRAIDHQEKR